MVHISFIGKSLTVKRSLQINSRLHGTDAFQPRTHKGQPFNTQPLKLRYQR